MNIVRKYAKDIILSMMNKYVYCGYPMRRMIIFIKYWTKQNGINDAPHHYMNSFGFTIMFIKFIQFIDNKIKF